MGDVEPLGRPAEVELLGEHDERFEQPQVDRRAAGRWLSDGAG